MMVLSAIRAHPLPAMNLMDRGAFVENMLFLHALMVASESLIEEVLKREMADPLRAFYAEHLEEERGHADWLAADLLTMGVHPRAVDWRAAQVVGPQYYLVRHGPVQALLGYMAALECRPMSLDVVKRLERIHGTDAMRTIRYHAEHDIDHSAALLHMIDTAGETPVVAYSAGLTALMLRWALSEGRLVAVSNA